MSANTTEAIDGLTTAVNGIGGTFLLITLIVIPVVLLLVMYLSKSMTLGFPAGMFWFILGGYAYTQSAATWDILYLLFFASMGMGIFSIFAAYALRTKKEEAREGDLYFDEGGDRDVRFIDEGIDLIKNDGRGVAGVATDDGDGDRPSARVKAIRDRAAKRRSRWS